MIVPGPASSRAGAGAGAVHSLAVDPHPAGTASARATLILTLMPRRRPPCNPSMISPRSAGAAHDVERVGARGADRGRERELTARAHEVVRPPRLEPRRIPAEVAVLE